MLLSKKLVGWCGEAYENEFHQHKGHGSGLVSPLRWHASLERSVGLESIFIPMERTQVRRHLIHLRRGCGRGRSAVCGAGIGALAQFIISSYMCHTQDGRSGTGPMLNVENCRPCVCKPRNALFDSGLEILRAPERKIAGNPDKKRPS